MFNKKYPKTTFIFNSILLTNRPWLNAEVNKFNNCVFDLTLRANTNIWFYDSHHIAQTLGMRGVQVLETKSRRANGVHLTYPVTNEIRANISYCLNVLCADSAYNLREIWPLRREFRLLANRRKMLS